MEVLALPTTGVVADQVPRRPDALPGVATGSSPRVARRVLPVARGERRAAVVAAVEGPVSAMCPASVPRFHRAVTVVVDGVAGSRPALTGCYRSVAEAGHRLRQEER